MAAICLVGARAPRGHPPTARIARGVTRGSPPAQVVDCKIGNNGGVATCLVGDRTGEQAAWPHTTAGWIAEDPHTSASTDARVRSVVRPLSRRVAFNRELRP